MNSSSNDEVERVLMFAREHLRLENAVSGETRLLQDLGLVGDDAEEFLRAISNEMQKDVSGLNFSDYFPAEASAEMNFVLATRGAANGDRSAVLRSVNSVEKFFWGLFAEKRGYRELTLEDLAKMPPR